MSIFNEFPYLSMHELNLDWILHQVKILRIAVNEFLVRLGKLEQDFQDFKDQIDDWETRIQIIEQTIADVSATVDALEQSVNDLNDRVGAAEEKINANATEIDSIKGQIITINNSITSINGELSALNTTISNLLSRVAYNETAISTLQNAIRQAQSDITDLQSDITGLQSNITILQSNVTALQTDISDINGKIGNMANLQTTAKDTLVAAINEAAQTGGGGEGTVVGLEMVKIYENETVPTSNEAITITAADTITGRLDYDFLIMETKLNNPNFNYSSYITVFPGFQVSNPVFTFPRTGDQAAFYYRSIQYQNNEIRMSMSYGGVNGGQINVSTDPYVNPVRIYGFKTASGSDLAGLTNTVDTLQTDVDNLQTDVDNLQTNMRQAIVWINPQGGSNYEGGTVTLTFPDGKSSNDVLLYGFEFTFNTAFASIKSPIQWCFPGTHMSANMGVQENSFPVTYTRTITFTTSDSVTFSNGQHINSSGTTQNSSIFIPTQIIAIFK